MLAEATGQLIRIAFSLAMACLVDVHTARADITQDVRHHFASNDGVNLHYVSLGEKEGDLKNRPLAVMLHGFPDFWYTWRHQMPALAKTHYVVAMDLRGYNKSDKPNGVENYSMPVLMSDVVAVIEHAGYEKAVIIGNDWGGAIAWNLASFHPQRVERLIVCNLPHMKGLTRELNNNPRQQEASGYARDFQKPDAHKNLSPTTLTRIVAGNRSADVQEKYQTAFENSDIESMLNYYKANFPRPGNDPRPGNETSEPTDMPNVQCPTLIIHGLKDKALLASGLNDNWDWVDNELTILTLPGADHFAQQDAPSRVTKAITQWLGQ